MVAQMTSAPAIPRPPTRVRWKGALLAAGIAVPASIVAFGLSISEALGPPDPSYVFESHDLMPVWLAIAAIGPAREDGQR